MDIYVLQKVTSASSLYALGFALKSRNAASLRLEEASLLLFFRLKCCPQNGKLPGGRGQSKEFAKSLGATHGTVEGHT